ncbi:hypothetical protein [Micromonospora qiuiae]|uniref:hypothetical protein n=1 Tax=Micromonospora qiuiae TaxID=502268 RepID=UPI001EF31785|nr:hypothetical protein [Micromonospora qiuiae]
MSVVDASEPAIRAAEAGSVPEVVDVKAPARLPEPAAVTEVEVVGYASDGVIVECVERSGRLRVQVLSTGYHRDWSVQFPKGIREPGARYLVTEVRESGRGSFYRAYGDIRRLR